MSTSLDGSAQQRMGAAALRGTGGDASLDAIANRVLWLAVRMVHEANANRPSTDGLKVGGHQASSSSAVSILTALYFRWLRPHDFVSVKPHASPAYHAIRCLLGDLDPSYLTCLRSFEGLQAYPSRTKDPDPVDFSTGSVGLGAVAPLFASLADRYLRLHQPDLAATWPERRFVAIVGDAELDEGNVWEAALEEALRGLGNVTMIVDLNRQSLDRVVPGIRARHYKEMFAAAGWHVTEAKYGSRLESLFASPGGETLRRRIDGMSNEEYQVLLRRAGADVRSRLIEGTERVDRDPLAQAIAGLADVELPAILGDLGGHDTKTLLRALDDTDAERKRPSVVFAYTIKGWRLPFSGDALNHSALLSSEQIEKLAIDLGADPSDPWALFGEDTPEGRVCAARGDYLRERTSAGHVGSGGRAPLVPETLDVPVPARTSTQQAFGAALTALARVPSLGRQIVTASPDVSISTSLGGWINRVGVFATQEAPVLDEIPRSLTWAPKPAGQHVELGISEMNLFMWLSQFGLTRELFGEMLLPIGTVYDPFVCRGLDALIYSLYVQSRFILVATPSGVTLAPEGGAHQSTITPSIGIELPGLRSYEPAFALEAVWMLLEGLRGCIAGKAGFSTYLRLSTRLVDQDLSSPVPRRLGIDEWRRQAIAGAYRLISAEDHRVELPPNAPRVNIVAAGAVVPEACKAVTSLIDEEVAANLIVVTSPGLLAAEVHACRLGALRRETSGRLLHLDTLIPPSERKAPMVTVMDGSSHALSFLGSVFGAPVVPLGVDQFGRSGTIDDLYACAGIDSEHIIRAALLALDLGAE